MLTRIFSKKEVSHSGKRKRKKKKIMSGGLCLTQDTPSKRKIFPYIKENLT